MYEVSVYSALLTSTTQNSQITAFTCKLKMENTIDFNPRRMHEGYGTCSVIHSFYPSSCRDQQSLLHAGKVMSMISMTMACKFTRGFC